MGNDHASQLGSLDALLQEREAFWIFRKDADGYFVHNGTSAGSTYILFSLHQWYGRKVTTPSDLCN
jgi:hypothetical protein